MKDNPQTYILTLERFSTSAICDVGKYPLPTLQAIVLAVEMVIQEDLKCLTVYRNGLDRAIWMFKITNELQEDGSFKRRKDVMNLFPEEY